MRLEFLLAVNLLAADPTFREHALPHVFASGEGVRKYMPGTMGGGLAVLDFDGDGRMDLFLTNGAELPGLKKTLPAFANHLLRNKGDFVFEDVTEGSGLRQYGYAMGAAAGDFDHDGKVDLVVLGLGFIHLYRNLGGGKFEWSELPNQGRWAYAAQFADLDGDGDLDLFVVNYVKWSEKLDRECLVAGKPDYCHPRFYEPSANQLFENLGTGKFRDVSAKSGIAAHLGKGMGLAIGDFDGNGLPDIFVTNDRVLNFLFLNRGGLKFEEKAFDWGVAVPADGKSPSAMGTVAADLDSDGKVDLIYTALKEETFPVYRNRGKDFQDVGISSGVAKLTRNMAGWGIAVADFDGDGKLDLVIARSDALSPKGSRGEAAKEPLSMLLNLGGMKFEAWDVLPATPRMYRWLAVADFNNDGCPDIAVTALSEAAVILENPCARSAK